MPRPAARRQSGFTLIEVMVAFALTMVLMIGMSALWTVVATQFDSLVYRQKAIFRLNGEMERLVAQYGSKTTDPTVQGTDAVVDYTPVPDNAGSFLSTTPASNNYPSNGSNANRRIYVTAGTPVYVGSVTTATTPAFTDPISADGGATLGGTGKTAQQVYSNILITGSGTARRNLVWLDQAHQVVGQLSWDICLVPNTSSSTDYFSGQKDCMGITIATSSPCYSTACYFLTVYLDYPFRFDATNKVGVPIPGTSVETITAQTIVGKRKS